jgi:branched-subunit amino acid aminotransferase/4-amino-4-deoxychorismate lyase
MVSPEAGEPAMSLWVDGEAASAADLAVPALVNYGHFTAMQVRRGAVRGLASHLRRVDAAHRELFGHGLDPGLVRGRWALAARRQPDASLRATFYETPDGQVHDLVVLRPPAGPPAAPQRLRSVSYVRPLAHVKHTGTFAQIYYWQEAERAGYDDALLTTAAGEAAETTMANIGFTAGNRVTWPGAPALHGTGQQLLEAALPGLGLTGGRAPVRLADLPGFDGAFTVNSAGVASVAQVDGHRFAGPGAAVAEIIRAHARLPWDQL